MAPNSFFNLAGAVIGLVALFLRIRYHVQSEVVSQLADPELKPDPQPDPAPAKG